MMGSADWPVVPISSVCTGIYDGPHATPTKTDDGPVFLGISNLVAGRVDLTDVEHLSEDDFIQWTRRVTPREGDIVFSYETRLGEVAMIPAGLRCCLGRRMALMRPDPTKIEGRYLLYAYLGPEFQEILRSRTVHGSTVDRLPLIEFPEFPIRLPSLPEQRAIAAILGALDDKIELNRRMNETLEAIARTLFTSWFVDFDPVRAKMEGREPAGMDAEAAALFPAAFEESALGEVPAGWVVQPLPAIIDVNPSRALLKGTIAPYLEMSNMPTQSARVIAWEDRPLASGMKFMNGDTLVARITPCLENGKTAYVDFLANGQVGWGSTEYIVLHSKWPLPPEYTYFLARSDTFRIHAIRNMTGTSGRQRVPAECFNSFLTVLPSAPVAARFGTLATATMAAMKGHDDESRTLAAIRDALLPKLLAGEVRVREAERLVEAVV